MTWIATNLWELLRPGTGKDVARPAGRTVRDRPVPTPAAAPKRPPRSTPTMRDRYDAVVVEMKSTYGIRVRKWRNSSSGVAWELHDRAGNVSRLIEAPYPRGPISCAIFLHEIGHHAIGFRTYRPRCLEEYHTWAWALEAMRSRGLNVTPAVEHRMHDALHYAIEKARRRGLKRLPQELVPFLEPRAARRRAALITR